MAERPASERTEPPTPERLRKAREQGQAPQSQELPSALVLGLLLTALVLAGPALWHWFTLIVREGLAVGHSGTGTSLAGTLRARLVQAMGIVAPFFIATIAAGILAGLAVSGFAFSPGAVKMKLDRINPTNGLRNLFSRRAVVRLVVTVVKFGAIAPIVFFYVRANWARLLAMGEQAPAAGFLTLCDLLVGVTLRIVVALVPIAIADLLYQRWQHRKDLRMTRQEVKEERRQHEAAPEVMRRIRTIQMEMARRRMLQDVPTADVVVTNPTHYAVALKYDTDTMDAPTVVAKGQDLVGERIKEVAREHGVPILRRPELARGLFAACDVGQIIPEALYVAVAEVLALIYRMRGRTHTSRT